MKAILTVMISTIAERISSISLTTPVEGINYIIVVQNFNNICLSIPKEIDNRQDVKIIISETKGLSISRNIALKAANARYGLVSDDDVAYDSNFLKELRDFLELSETLVYTFKAWATDKCGDFKSSYSSQSFRHSISSVAKVSSIEICVNLKRINDLGIFFDEDLGLGTDLPSGEEFVFLSNALRTGQDVFYYPLYCCGHPIESSGKNFYSDKAKIKAKSEMINRVFPKISMIIKLIFVLKKAPTLIKNRRFFFFFINFIF